MRSNRTEQDTARFADIFSAMGIEPRLRIMRVLLSAHPDGMFAGEIAAELGTSTLSHHLDKLKNGELVTISREGTYLRYCANTEILQDVSGFLYAECCTRNKAVSAEKIVCCANGSVSSQPVSRLSGGTPPKEEVLSIPNVPS